VGCKTKTFFYVGELKSHMLMILSAIYHQLKVKFPDRSLVQLKICICP